MSTSLIQRLLDDEMAEPYQELLESGEVDRATAADSLERGKNLGVLHHPASQRGVERGQGEGSVLEDLDELAASAKKEHRPELGIKAAADDDLVAVELDHRLDADSLEVLRAGALRDRRLDGTERRAHRVRVSQVEENSAHVGLVSDRLGVELQHDRVAQILGGGDSGVGSLGNHGLDGGNAIGRQELFGLGLGEYGPALAPDRGNDRLGALRATLAVSLSTGRLGVS